MGPTARDLRLRRATAQLLAGSTNVTYLDVVDRLLAVQAQEFRSARLALRARSAGLTVADVDRGLTEDRSLVVTWLFRGTLHLVLAEDYSWLLRLTAPTRLTTNRRRLAQEGVTPQDAARGMALINRALADEGPLTRSQLVSRLAGHGVRTDGQATPHLLMSAALRGDIVLGPITPHGPAFVRPDDWLGIPPVQPLTGEGRDRALGELARRYLRGHGPAAPGDLATWSGLPVRDARIGLQALGRGLVEVDGGLVDLAGREPPADRLPPRLLPSFDPYLLGWQDRTFAVSESYAKRVHPGGGVIRPVATAAGLAVGTWRAERRGAMVKVRVAPFEPLSAAVSTALDREATDVARFLGTGFD